MPYRQFTANPTGEVTSKFYDSLQDNYLTPVTANCGYTATEIISNKPVSTASVPALSLSPGITLPVTFPTYPAPAITTGLYDKVIFENKFFINSVGVTDPKQNDTIVRQQVFDNYLAYDDGTAELSYYLTPGFSPLTASIALEFHLNKPDTMRGLAIYFGRQAPPPGLSKTFSIRVWSRLGGVHGASVDNVLYSNDFIPGYADTVNNFYVYKFDKPVVLPAGIFYAGAVQPAYGGGDSLYYGLDVNRVGSNHAYYNVQGTWVSSQINGAIMMRPLLGQGIQGTQVSSVNNDKIDWSVSPNPVLSILKVNFASIKGADFLLTDVLGRTVLSGNIKTGDKINVSALTPGMYFARLYIDGEISNTIKIIKQ